MPTTFDLTRSTTTTTAHTLIVPREGTPLVINKVGIRARSPITVPATISLLFLTLTLIRLFLATTIFLLLMKRG
jgi:hypothetical protein